MTHDLAALDIEAVVIGGSAGALDALAAILPALPRELPAPLALVLHIPSTQPSSLPEVLGARCELRVKEAEDKEPFMAGTLYVAPPNYHLLLETRRCLSLSIDEPVHYSRPSIDVLFESAADAYGPALVGVLLTGASEDGALGLARIAERGGTTIVQDPEAAAVRTMPQAALRLHQAGYVLPASEIGPCLVRLCSRGVASGEGE